MGNQALKMELNGSKKFIPKERDEINEEECEICGGDGYIEDMETSEAFTCECMKTEDIFNQIDNKI